MCKSFAAHCRQITTPAPHHLIFSGQMFFLMPNQQCQSTEGMDKSTQLNFLCNDGDFAYRSFIDAAKFLKISFSPFFCGIILVLGCDGVRIRIQMLSDSNNFLQIRNPTDFQTRVVFRFNFRFGKASFIVRRSRPLAMAKKTTTHGMAIYLCPYGLNTELHQNFLSNSVFSTYGLK